MGASNKRPRDASPPPPRLGRWGSAASETGRVVSGHMWLPDEGTRSPTSQISAQRLWLYDQGSRSPFSQTTAQKIHQNCKSPSQDGGVRVKFAYKTHKQGLKQTNPSETNFISPILFTFHPPTSQTHALRETRYSWLCFCSQVILVGT